MVRVPVIVALALSLAFAQANRYNYDESKIPPYTIPDALTLADGSRVKDVQSWNQKRRPELIALFEDQVYGKTPSKEIPLRTNKALVDAKALGGKAIRKQVTLYFSDRNDGPQLHLLIYLPAKSIGPVPVFVGLNFSGNHTVDADPGILSNDVWVKDPGGSGKWTRLPPDDRTHGSGAANWQVEKILAHGYGLATAYCYDIEPDFVGGMEYGVRPLFPEPENWSALGAWAWGLSRIADYLRTDKNIDSDHIALIGHSRLGKAALWAAGAGHALRSGDLERIGQRRRIASEARLWRNYRSPQYRVPALVQSGLQTIHRAPGETAGGRQRTAGADCASTTLRCQR